MANGDYGWWIEREAAAGANEGKAVMLVRLPYVLIAACAWSDPRALWHAKPGTTQWRDLYCVRVSYCGFERVLDELDFDAQRLEQATTSTLDPREVWQLQPERLL